MIIIDTNVMSELMLRRPDPRVLEWSNRVRPNDLVTTAICELELRAGPYLIKPGKRRVELVGLIDWMLNDLLQNRVLPFDRKAAVASAEWYAKRRTMGRRIDNMDAQIAGIALSRRIPIATRNIDDFEGIDVKVFSPWAA